MSIDVVKLLFDMARVTYLSIELFVEIIVSVFCFVFKNISIGYPDLSNYSNGYVQSFYNHTYLLIRALGLDVLPRGSTTSWALN